MRIFIIIVLWLLTTPIKADQLISANSHWPPWRVIEADGSITGIEADILKRLSARMQLSLVTKNCGWKRCLKQMEMGGSDIMTGLFKTPEREVYMKFIEPPYRLEQKICFYQHADSTLQLNSFEDLYKLNVGVVDKVVYFNRFDNDTSINKIVSTTDEYLFRLLQAERIDAVAMACVTGDIHLKRLGLTRVFKHAKYVYRIAHPVYMAISKQSHLLAREGDISLALQSMIDAGEINEIMAGYGIISP